MIEKPWHYDMMTDTMYVRPWFAVVGLIALGVLFYFYVSAILALMP